MREMLLCTVMCFYGTGWRKHYCVQLCVYKVQDDGIITEHNDECQRYRVGEILLCTVMCLCGTGIRKLFCVE